MKLSLNWLKRYVPLSASAEEITRALTFLGFEVEGVERTGLEPIDNLVVGEILTREKHPNADRLSVCTVRVALDGEPEQIVCGAPNCDVGNFVPVALVGAVLPGDFKIKRSKIRGVESRGMMCSPQELNLGADHGGLFIFESKPAVGTPVHKAMGKGDVVFDVEITPNRPDVLSHLGMARELAAWFQLPLTYPEIKPETISADDAKAGAAILNTVEVDNVEACPHYTAHIVQGVKIGPSPAWLCAALEAVGLRPINNIVDITNFVLLEMGQPLHAFDARKIRGGKLLIRNATEGETIVTLDDKSRKLRATDLVIADAERALVVAGIMGGADAEVDDSTVDLVLESAYFRPIGVRRTSKHLQLSSDSSYRFERGVDPRGVLPAARRALDLILEVAGGRALGPVLVAGSEPNTEQEVRLSPDFVRARCGFDIPDDVQRDVLARLELSVAREEEDDNGRKQWTVTVPSWRGDIDRPIDLVEEVLRVHGTEKIPSIRPVVKAVVPQDDAIAVFVRRAGETLAARDFVEAVNYTLRSEAELKVWAGEAAVGASRLDNPLAEDQSHLRASLLPGLLDSVRFNQARQNWDGRFFETGRTFHVRDGVVFEHVSVAFVIAQPEGIPSWKHREPADLFSAKNVIASIAGLAGIKLRDEQYQSVSDGSFGWQENHAAAVKDAAQGFEVRCGLVDLAATRAAGLDGTVIAGVFTILPEKLRCDRQPVRFRAVGAFPAATRDVALICDDGIPAGEVATALTSVTRKVLKNAFALEAVKLFDVFRGQGLPEGKKSLAFSLVFRSNERTLTDAEVNTVFAAVQTEIESVGYPVRK